MALSFDCDFQIGLAPVLKMCGFVQIAIVGMTCRCGKRGRQTYRVHHGDEYIGTTSEGMQHAQGLLLQAGGVIQYREDAAAELATPDANELRLAVDAGRQRLESIVADRMSGLRRDLEDRRRRLTLASPARRILEQSQKVEGLHDRLARAMQSLLRMRNDALAADLKRLEALSPQAVLDRGYAHVTRSADGSTVNRSDDLSVGEGLKVRVSEGSFDAVEAGQAKLDLGGGEG